MVDPQWRAAVAAACLTTTVATSGLAQTQPAADTLKERQAETIVVSATRWKERASNVSREILPITPQDIVRGNPATMADALTQTGSVYVQKSQLGGGSPMLRGYAANAVLMVVDGVRINNAIYRGGNLQNVITIDGNGLDGAEVLFGPGSVQYGSDALGGVMVFRTHQAAFSDEGTTLRGNAMVRYGDAMQERTATATIDVAGERLASSTTITHSSFGSLRTGGSYSGPYPDFGLRPWSVQRINGVDSQVVNTDPSLLVGSGYTQLNIIENLSWRVSDLLTLKYGGIFTTSSDIPRYDRLVELSGGKPRAAEWYYGPQFWTMHTLSATFNDAGILGNDAVVAASFQSYEESRNDRRFGDNRLRTQTEGVTVGSVNADIRVRLSGIDEPERDLYYGVEAYVNDVTSTAQRRNIVTGDVTSTATRYPDGGSTVWSGAAYAQLRYGVSSDLTVAGGMRYSIYDMASTLSDSADLSTFFSDLSLSTSALTGSIGATYHASDMLTVHANVASGFRAPNVDDIAKVFDTAPGLLVVPNPDLGPEYSYTAEAGVDLRMGRTWKASVNAYHTWAIDAIERRPFRFGGQDSVDVGNGEFSKVFSNVNVGQAVIYGTSVRVDGRITGFLDAGATVTYTNGRDVENDIPLRHVPPAFGTVRLGWNDDRWSAGASFWWAATKPFSELPADEKAKLGINYTPDGTPAWQRLDVAASYRIVDALQLRASLENIFDVRYMTFASAISAPGRNLVVSLRYVW